MELVTQLCSVASTLDAHFYLNDKPIAHEEALAPTGLLPAIARRADQLCSLCFGYGIGISFDEAGGSILGVKVNFDSVTPQVLRLLCMTDVLCDLMESSPDKTKTLLDELLYD